MADLTNPPDKQREVTNKVESLSDLPKGGYLVELETEKLKIPFEARSSMAVWCVAGFGHEPGATGTPVWLLVTDNYIRDIQFMGHKRTVQKAGYKVERTVRIDKNLLQALYDGQSSPDSDLSGKKNEIIEYYEEMVSVAIREGVSDIHIERRRSSATIRMRKHGQMMVYKELSPRFCLDLCTVVYNVLAETKDVNFMPNEYQAAAVNTRIQGVEVKLRYQSLPVYPDGFDVILRVLPIGGDDEGAVDLSLLGYSPTQVQDLITIASKPVGALIIAGTTGSGKSTTLKNILMFINESRGYRCKIYTIEDPPEYKIPKVSQIPVIRRKNEDYSKKSPFADPLVATMRADPDILMIGEIRDGFTGDGLKKATQSGHQVLTTLHASSALGSIERLSDFGITPSVMGSPEFINGLVYQKLMPIVCTNCSMSFTETLSKGTATKSDLELADRVRVVADLEKDNIRLRNPKGCEKCKGMGVVGRTVCAEVIAPDFTLLKLFRQRASIEAQSYWRSLSDGRTDSDNMTGKPVLEHAILKMRRGLVSPHDIEDLLGPIDGAVRMLEQMRRDKEEDERVGSSVRGIGLKAAPAEEGERKWDPGY